MEVHTFTKESFLAREEDFLDVARDIPDQAWTREQFLAERPGKFGMSFWFEDKGVIAGYAIVSLVSAHRLHVHHFMVSAPHRGGGLGKQMNNHLDVVARQNGVGEISLKVPALFQRSKSFYERNGFSEQQRDGDYFVMLRSVIGTG